MTFPILEVILMNLDKQILKEIGQIASHHPEIQKILLFGSRARGDNSERSDIDLAVYAKGSISTFIEEIELMTTTLLEYDITHITELTEDYFLEQINREGIVIYEKNSI